MSETESGFHWPGSRSLRATGAGDDCRLSAAPTLLGSSQAETATQRGSFQFQIGKPGFRKPLIIVRTDSEASHDVDQTRRYLSLSASCSCTQGVRACAVLRQTSRLSPSRLLRIAASQGFKSGSQFHFGNGAPTCVAIAWTRSVPVKRDSKLAQGSRTCLSACNASIRNGSARWIREIFSFLMGQNC